MAIDPVMARFPAQPASVRAARQFVAETLLEGGAANVVEDAQLLVSELATNAVIHARTDFSVSVHLAAGHLYVELRDGDRTRPKVVEQRDAIEFGVRGLQVVTQLAGDWGSRIEDHGKVVWFSLDA